MPVDHDFVRRSVADAVETATSELRLRHDGPEGLRALLRRAHGDGVPGRSRRRAIAWLVATLIGGVLLAGGAAVAREAYLDTDDLFRDLHPDKSDVDSTQVEPHALVGSVPGADGLQIRLYATTATGAGSCASVQEHAANGAMLSSIGFCGSVTATDLQAVNGALVGYLPDRYVDAVRVTGPGGSARATVRYRYTILPAKIGTPGSTVTISQYDADGRHLRDEVVTIPD
jgi:hypothetical protein